MWSKSRNNKNSLRLLKQVIASELDMEYNIPRLRHDSYCGCIGPMVWWDLPARWTQRSWKKHRKTQYK